MTTAKNVQTTLATKLIAGFQKHLPSGTPVRLNSNVYTGDQIAAVLQLLVDLRAEVLAARAIVKTKLIRERDQAPPALAFMAGIVEWVRMTFEGSPEILADFGVKPKKARTPLTVQQHVVAVARRASTRKARGTTSKKARRRVKGSVVGVVLQALTVEGTGGKGSGLP